MSYVFLQSVSSGKLTQLIQAYLRTNSLPLEPRHGTPPPSQSLVSFPSPPIPTSLSPLWPICEKGELRKPRLSYLEVVSHVASCLLSLNSGQHQSFPSCSSLLKGTTVQMPSRLPLLSASYSMHRLRRTEQTRYSGGTQRAGMVAFLEHRMIKPFMDELGQSTGFSSILL